MIIREFRSLVPLIRQYRWHYAAGVLALLVTSGAQLLLPHLLGQAVDMLVPGQTGLAGDILPHVGLILGVAIIVALGRFGWRYFIQGCSRRIEAALREQVFNHILTLSPAFFRRFKTGDLMARATNDMNAVRMAVGMGLVAFVDGLFMTVAILIILFGRNPRLALMTILPLPVITMMIIAVGGRVGTLFREVQEGFSTMSDQVQEVLSGIRVVKAFVKEDFFSQRFARANHTYQRHNMRLLRIWGVFFPLVTFLSGLTILILLFVGGTALLEGTITTGDFVATLSYLQMMIWPMLGAGFTVNMVQRGAASLKRINEILDTEPGPPVPPNRWMGTGFSAGFSSSDGVSSSDGGAPRGTTIEVRNLTVSYEEDLPPALRNVSITITPGMVVGILGKTGSGKTTLVNTLTRIVDPPDGTVLVDNHDIRQWDLNALRRRFSVVPQSSFLFSATIANNIRFSRPDAPQDAMVAAARRAALEGEVQGFPEHWDTVVGERGVTLSGGQRQRVAIARALLNPADILILDDALSAVDTATEELILQELFRHRGEQTLILISNRVSTLRRADHILVLEDGMVVREGFHESLITEPGLYQDIFRLQQLESGSTRLDQQTEQQEQQEQQTND